MHVGQLAQIWLFRPIFAEIKFKSMQLTLETHNPNELQLILQFVKLLPTVKILADPKNWPKLTETFPVEQPKSEFLQYVGILQTGLTNDEIDEKLDQTRKHEWERAI